MGRVDANPEASCKRGPNSIKYTDVRRAYRNAASFLLTPSPGTSASNLAELHLFREHPPKHHGIDVEVVIFLDIRVDAEVLVSDTAREGVEVARGTCLGIEHAHLQVVAVEDAAERGSVRRDDRLGVAEELDLLFEGVVLDQDLLEAELFQHGDGLLFVDDAAMLGARP
jgi:hypothetical protein